MRLLDFLSHFTYLGYQTYFVGMALVIEWGLHYRRLWRQRWRILAVAGLITLYGSALDAWAVSQGWGWFNPRLITNVWFGPLLLEEITFWMGTSLATVSAVMIFAGLEESGAPWWRLPIDFIFNSDAVQALIARTRLPPTESPRREAPSAGPNELS
jgi:lycopene cyclase domain-containing protein